MDNYIFQHLLRPRPVELTADKNQVGIFHPAGKEAADGNAELIVGVGAKNLLEKDQGLTGRLQGQAAALLLVPKIKGLDRYPPHFPPGHLVVFAHRQGKIPHGSGLEVKLLLPPGELFHFPEVTGGGHPIGAGQAEGYPVKGHIAVEGVPYLIVGIEAPGPIFINGQDGVPVAQAHDALPDSKALPQGGTCTLKASSRTVPPRGRGRAALSVGGSPPASR